MADEIYFYSILHNYCTCRGKDGNLRNIGKLYRTYYNELQEGRSGIDILNDIDDGEGGRGLLKMCCRSRFLSIPIIPMIDTSKAVIYDDRRKETITDLEKISPGYMPKEFPPLSGNKALKIIPPKVKIEGELPKGF